jgi:hypothetical protein
MVFIERFGNGNIIHIPLHMDLIQTCWVGKVRHLAYGFTIKNGNILYYLLQQKQFFDL